MRLPQTFPSEPALSFYALSLSSGLPAMGRLRQEQRYLLWALTNRLPPSVQRVSSVSLIFWVWGPRPVELNQF